MRVLCRPSLPVGDSKRVRKRAGLGQRLKVEWDLVFWMFACFAMLYFTDFASHILFDTVVRRCVCLCVWSCVEVL